MKTLTHLLRQSLLALSVILFAALAAAAQTTAFSHQGKLPDEYNQPTGLYDLRFNLYDEASGMNSPLNATPIIVEDVQVTEGVFTVNLDFGNLFNGNNRYLELSVRSGESSGSFTVVSPRLQIMSAPYTIRSLSAATAEMAADSQSLGGTTSSSFVQSTDSRLTDPRLPIPGSNDYIQNTTSVQSAANFNIDGTGTASVLNATTQFNIGGNRVFSVAGLSNVFAGKGAGANNSGDDNSFFGNQAGMNSTTGVSNSFFGGQAGINNNTGFRNSFLGSGAGANNTTGHNNSFFGGGAGNTNTTGNYNVFIGESSFINNSGSNQAGTSSYNTFVGALAQVTPSGPLFFASAIGARSVVASSDTIVLGKISGVYDGISRPADTVQIPGHLQVTGSITASSFNGSGLTNLNASNITTGTLDNARLSLVPIAKGGTGLTATGANGNFLRSNGTAFQSAPLLVGDIPDLSGSYIRNQTSIAQSGSFNIAGNGTASGTLSGSTINATTQFNIGGNRVLSVPGTNNIFAGHGAGVANTTGSLNSFFGFQAGNSNTSGVTNSFLGMQAGYTNTTGSNNSFLGMQAGLANTTGQNNTFVGVAAGSSNTTGKYNTVLGAGATPLADNLFFATAIGADATVSTSDTIVLGKVASDYSGGPRPADTVLIPGDLNVIGTISGNINGTGFTNLNASNITTGTLDPARLGVIGVVNGGTGLISSGPNGNFLRSNGTGFTSSALAASDIPSGNTNYVQNRTTQQAGANFNIAGNGVVGGSLSVSGSLNANGSGLTNLDASNITSGTLADVRLSSNVATLSGMQTFTGAKSFANGIIGDGSGITGLNANNISSGTVDTARLGVVGVANGGTGLTTAGSNGNFLRSNGAGFTSSSLAATDIPSGSTNYIQNTTTSQTAANFNVSGNGVVGGDLSVTGALNASGLGLTNLNATSLTTGTLDNARLGLIPTANISDGAITASKIGDSGVTTTKIADSAVTATKISSNEVVKNLNGLTDHVTLAAGANVTITPAGNTLTIATNVGNFIQNSTTQQPGSNFNISGDGLATNLAAANTLSGNIVNATTQFNINGSQVLRATGTANIFAGNAAGSGNSTGAANSFVGVNAGSANTTGGHNSILGSAANVGSGDLSYATAIGAESTVSSNNTIVLGRSAGQDAVQIPGNLNVTGSIAGNINGTTLTNLNASNISTGTLDNARLGIVGVANGGTGLNVSGASGNLLRSNGTAFTSSALQPEDVPDLGASYIRNQTSSAQSGGFNLSGNGTAANLTASGALSGSIVNTATYFNIDGNRVLSQLGSNNIFVGYQTGLNNTTGDRNTFLGITAGKNNVIGHTNAFVGFQAGYNNNSNSNAFFGSYTGYANTDGYFNSFLGSTAGYSNTTGGNNSFVGTNAGRNNTTGYGNLFLGSHAAYASTTGYNNSFVGTNAGQTNTTGIANTLLGANANVGSDNLYYATAIGSDAIVSTSNTIVLGRSAGQDTVQIPGAVGIGTSSPNALLHVVTPSTTGDALRLQRSVSNNGWGVAQYFVLKNSSGAAVDYAAFAGAIGNNTAGAENGYLGFFTRNQGTLTEQARLDSSGNLGIGTSSPTAKLHVAGTLTVDGIAKLNQLGTAGGSSLCRNASNQIAACSSSLRYKTKVAPFSFGLSLVRRLHPIRFEWKDGGMKDLGFGAEDVAAVEPLLVTYDANGTVEGVKYDRISAVLVNAVKEQQAQIETQQVLIKQQQVEIEKQQQQLRQQGSLILGLKRLVCAQNPNAELCK